MNQNLKILILEDDALFSETLEDFLSECGFCITICEDGECAVEKSYEESFDLLLLDVNVPKLNGFEVLQTIREQNNNTPAIFLTSFKDKDSVIKGFDKGADDYLKKPVDLDELYMRINAVLKRSCPLSESIQVGKHLYQPERKMICIDDKEISLSKKLSSLLELLIQNRNKIVTKEQISQEVWGWDKELSDGSLRVYIGELKKIIGKDMIQNYKGLGYKLEL